MNRKNFHWPLFSSVYTLRPLVSGLLVFIKYSNLILQLHLNGSVIARPQPRPLSRLLSENAACPHNKTSDEEQFPRSTTYYLFISDGKTCRTSFAIKIARR